MVRASGSHPEGREKLRHRTHGELLSKSGSNPAARATHKAEWRPIIWGQKLGKQECPFLRRWVLDFKLFSIRLHHWTGSDDNRALHDHPWSFLTFVFRGSYRDVTESGDEILKAPSIHSRSAFHLHSVQLISKSVWTLLITGPTKRTWGYRVGKRWVPSRRYYRENGMHPCD